MGRENIHLSTIVTTSDGLKNAVEAGYGTIVVEGAYAQEVASKVNNNNVGNSISNIALVAGLFFWPAFVGGMAGKVFTRKLKKYEIRTVEENRVVIVNKNRS